ncbi:hypothetical protein C6V08_34535 [Burkholderia gladioli]|nr:hypothetical protein [Burkholderia gladioli]MBU9324009.1 hypothetical protein [Burkholderia gladioli]PRG88470.1 hypothetical protein C6V08_34535 [Burkholderia gladioli]
MRPAGAPLRPCRRALNPRRGGSQWQIHNPTQKDETVSATTPDRITHTHAGVPPAPPEAHRLAGIRQPANRLRATAAHWLGCAADAPIRVLHRWARPDDDARAVRLEAVIDGASKRITLFRQPSGAWAPVWL